MFLLILYARRQMTFEACRKIWKINKSSRKKTSEEQTTNSSHLVQHAMSKSGHWDICRHPAGRLLLSSSQPLLANHIALKGMNWSIFGSHSPINNVLIVIINSSYNIYIYVLICHSFIFHYYPHYVPLTLSFTEAESGSIFGTKRWSS